MTRSGGSWRACASSSGVRAKMSGVPTSLAVSLIRATKKRSFTTPTTLIVLLLYPQPVLVPLREVGQRGEVTHAIEVDTAVEMIRFVLDDPREELLGHAVDPRAF